MLSKKMGFAAVVLSATMIANIAAAQSNWVEVDDEVTVAPFQATADDVDDWDVHDENGRKIGDVEEVVGSDARTPTALVVDFEDNGAYGGIDDVIVPLDQFSLEENALILKASPAAVSDMEIYRD